jgi:hypothetical protein
VRVEKVASGGTAAYDCAEPFVFESTTNQARAWRCRDFRAPVVLSSDGGSPTPATLRAW